MYVERVLSLNGGWSILTTRKSEEWSEALSALNAVDDDFINNTISGTDSVSVHVEYVYVSLYSFNKYYLSEEFGWAIETPANVLHKGPFSYNTLKNKVLVSQIGLNDLSGTSFPNQLHVIIPYAHHTDLIDVGVIFIPTNESIEHYLELGAILDNIEELPTEKFCREEAARFIALTSRTPIVLAFFSPTEPHEIITEELSAPKVAVASIERTIEFAPQYYQAGVGLLSYFGEVLRQKDPHTMAKVRIEQDGNTVRLHIVPPVGETEIIEKQLEQFALVISNQAPPETLFENRMHIMQLESRLEIAKIEIKNAHDLKQLTDGIYSQQIQNLQQQVNSLTQQVASQVLQQDKFINLIQPDSKSEPV